MSLTQDVVPLAPVGTIASVARKEDVYDTEGWDGGAAAVTLNLFQNYTAFTPAAGLLAKNNPRDTNMTGAQAGIPNGFRHHIYKWAAGLFTLNAVLSTAANVVVFEEINRMIELSAAIMRFESDWITAKLCDLVWSERNVNSNHAANTTISLPHLGLDPKGKDVTTRGKPKTLNANQPFRVQLQMPTAMTPTVDTYNVHFLRGVLQRGIG